MTRIDKLKLRAPRDRSGEFSTAMFKCYARSEKALVAALAEMYVQGVSNSTISAINKSLNGVLERFASRQFQESYPYLSFLRNFVFQVGAGHGIAGSVA